MTKQEDFIWAYEIFTWRHERPFSWCLARESWLLLRAGQHCVTSESRKISAGHSRILELGGSALQFNGNLMPWRYLPIWTESFYALRGGRLLVTEQWTQTKRQGMKTPYIWTADALMWSQLRGGIVPDLYTWLKKLTDYGFKYFTEKCNPL